jgi:tellurite resistance protein
METGHLDSVKAIVENMQSYADMVARQQEAAQQAAAQEAEAQQAALNEIGAMVEAAYLVAVADDELSDNEANQIVQGVAHLTDNRIPQEQVAGLVGTAAGKFADEGQHARIEAVASIITDSELRRAVFLVVAAVSWLDHGIGEKQGLALQALSRAFDIPMNEMHKLLAQAHSR